MFNQVNNNDQINVIQLQNSVKIKTLILQRIYRFIMSQKFEEAYSIAKPPEKEQVRKYINDGERGLIILWTKNILKDDFDSYSIMELRELGQTLGIKSYYSLSKDSLLSEIYKAKNCKESYEQGR